MHTCLCNTYIRMYIAIYICILNLIFILTVVTSGQLKCIQIHIKGISHSFIVFICVRIWQHGLESVQMAQLNKKYQVLNLLTEKYGCKIQFSPVTMEVHKCYVYVYMNVIKSYLSIIYIYYVIQHLTYIHICQFVYKIDSVYILFVLNFCTNIIASVCILFFNTVEYGR